MKAFLLQSGEMLALLLLQTMLFSHVHIAGYGVPMVHLYFLLDFRSDYSRQGLLLWSFFLGLAMDMFDNTPGLNTAVLTFTAMVRPWVISRCLSSQYTERMELGISTMGMYATIMYLLSCSLITCTLKEFVSVMSFSHIGLTLLRIVSSTFTTFLCLLYLTYLKLKYREI